MRRYCTVKSLCGLPSNTKSPSPSTSPEITHTITNELSGEDNNKSDGLGLFVLLGKPQSDYTVQFLLINYYFGPPNWIILPTKGRQTKTLLTVCPQFQHH